MENKPQLQSMKYEILSPLWMIGALTLVTFFDGKDFYTHKGMIVYSTQVHTFVVHMMWLVFWIYFNPAAVNTGAEVISGYIDPNPATTLPGAFGAGIKEFEKMILGR